MKQALVKNIQIQKTIVRRIALYCDQVGHLLVYILSRKKQYFSKDNFLVGNGELRKKVTFPRLIAIYTCLEILGRSIFYRT